MAHKSIKPHLVVAGQTKKHKLFSTPNIRVNDEGHSSYSINVIIRVGGTGQWNWIFSFIFCAVVVFLLFRFQQFSH